MAQLIWLKMGKRDFSPLAAATAAFVRIGVGGGVVALVIIAAGGEAGGVICNELVE